MVRWLLREGPTRSHSELGRETLLRQWYFSLSCGRVGHCRTFYTLYVMLLISLSLFYLLYLFYCEPLPPCGSFFFFSPLFLGIFFRLKSITPLLFFVISSPMLFPQYPLLLMVCFFLSHLPEITLI